MATLSALPGFESSETFRRRYDDESPFRGSSGTREISGVSFVRPLGEIWRELATGQLEAIDERASAGEVTMLARMPDHDDPSWASSPEADALSRVLCGDQQKLVAADSGRSRATICTLCRRGHEYLGVKGPLPTVMIIAAQSHRGIAHAFGRVARMQRGGEWLVSITTSRLAADVLSPLTRAEKEVAQLLVEGRSKDEIATLRSTACHTVTTQAHAIFAKTGATGRYALIRKIVNIMWPRAH